MAAFANLDALLNDDSDDDNIDDGGLPSVWRDATDTDVEVLLTSSDGPSDSVEITTMKVHESRLRAGAPGDASVMSKALVRHLDRLGTSGHDGKSAKKITIAVASGMMRHCGPLIMDYLYGKKLRITAASAVHLLLLATCKPPPCAAPHKG